MQIKVLRSKIHLATVTETRLDYEGSITLDEDLMEAVGLVPGEAVLVSNLANGSRQVTYVIPGDRGGGAVCLNGASARLAAVGDRLIIMGFAYLGPEELAGHVARTIVLGENNSIVRGP
jgi:aspartate 1-decarboxylase